MIFLLKPIVVVSRLLTRLISSHSEEGSRQQLSAMIATARQQGVLDQDEWKQLANLLTLEELLVSETMVPRTVVRMLPAETTVAGLIEHEASAHFSRIPLYEGSADEVIGYVFVREVLRGAAQGLSVETPLRELKRDLAHVAESTPARQVLDQLLERQEPMAVVQDAYGGTSGIVCMEDLLEAILGEPIHSSEGGQAVDLRALALQHRDRRLETLRQRLVLDAAELLPEESA